MHVNDLIRNRRSVFPASYTGEAIPKETISNILENANWAPTHKKTEPWRFKVIEDSSKEQLGKFLAETYQRITDRNKFLSAKYSKIQDNCRAASCIIAICMQRDPEAKVPEWEEVAATAMSVQNMWLTCSAYGLGCYWSSPDLVNYLGDFFKLSQGERCLGLFYIGSYGKESYQPNPKRNPIESKVEWLR